MKLDYDELLRIYRLEKNTSKLVEVEEDFFNSLHEFIQKERKEYLDSLKDLSSSKARDFSNLKKMVEELFALRQKKILNLALISARTEEPDSLDRMALQEKEVFDSLLESLQRHQKMFSEIFQGEAKPEKDLESVQVKILKEVPAFVGSDMKEYGPFTENESVSLPYNIGKLLVSRKIADLVEAE